MNHYHYPKNRPQLGQFMSRILLVTMAIFLQDEFTFCFSLFSTAVVSTTFHPYMKNIKNSILQISHMLQCSLVLLKATICKFKLHTRNIQLQVTMRFMSGISSVLQKCNILYIYYINFVSLVDFHNKKQIILQIRILKTSLCPVYRQQYEHLIYNKEK